MTFDDLQAGDALFLDANTLIYHFTNHPKYGAACTRLVERIELNELDGFSSAHCLADVAHRLMTIEAIGQLGWPAAGIAARLRRHHAEILTGDALVVAGMQRLGLAKLASADDDFDRVPGITRYSPM